MRVPRKSALLNDALDALDQRLHEAKQQLPKGTMEDQIARAWQLLSPVELQFIAEEIDSCVNSRVYYLENYHIIQPESGHLTCFKDLFDHQWMVEEAIAKERAATGQSKIIVDKPRQAGVTEYGGGVMCHSTFFTPNAYTAAVAQAPDVASHMQRKVTIALNGLPWWMRPETQYFNKGEYIEFNRKDLSERFTNPGLGSVYVTTHAQRGTGIAIGRTVRNLHMSETSRWASTEVYTGDLEPSMNAVDTMAICESTGLGAEGLFYNMWIEAVEGDSDWIPVFLPAYRAKKFSLPLKPSQKPFLLTAQEEAVRERVLEEEAFKVTDEFFNWRRRRIRSAIKRTGYPYAHYESYPVTWQESFQTSGLCAFPRHKLDEQGEANIRNPRWIGEIMFMGMHAAPKLTLTEVTRETTLEKRESWNRLYVWEQPAANASYYVAADTGAGILGGDPLAIQVFRAGSVANPDVQVAEWIGFAPPTEYAKILYALGSFYNKCEIAVEYAKEGMITANFLANDLEYPSLYRPRSEDRIGKQLANYLHWQTTSKTKPLIVGRMQEILLEDGVVLRSRYLLAEMYKYAKDGNTYNGLGSHDDSIIAAMIAMFCLRQTMPELRSPAQQDDAGRQTPGRGARPSGGGIVYGLYDQFMRLRGQTMDMAKALAFINANPGFQMKPIVVTKANTAYSIIHHGSGSEADLYRREGMDSWDILPGVVQAWRGAKSPDQGRESQEYEALLSGESWGSE